MTHQERIKQDAWSAAETKCGEDVTPYRSGYFYGYIAGATAEREQFKIVIDALEELVQLKQMKDELGKTTNYLARQPEAWRRAKEALEQWKGKEVGDEL